MGIWGVIGSGEAYKSTDPCDILFYLVQRWTKFCDLKYIENAIKILQIGSHVHHNTNNTTGRKMEFSPEYTEIK